MSDALPETKVARMARPSRCSRQKGLSVQYRGGTSIVICVQRSELGEREMRRTAENEPVGSSVQYLILASNTRRYWTTFYFLDSLASQPRGATTLH